MLNLKISSGSLFFATILFSQVCHASVTDSMFRDSKERLTFKEVAENIDLKIREHIRESPEYRYKSASERLRMLSLTGENFDFGIDESDFGRDIRKDVVDSVKYGFEHSIRDLEFYTVARQWFLGLLSLQVDKQKQRETIVTNLSASRPLNYYDEIRNNVGFECGNVVGQSAESLRRRIACFETNVFIKRSEDRIYNFRLRPGLNLRPNLNSSLIAPEAEIYTRIRLRKLDAKFSYTYPITIYKRGDGKDNSSPFDDLTDTFFDDARDGDRIRFKIDRYFITDSVSINGHYQLERRNLSHSIDLGLSYVKLPFKISIRTSTDILEKEPKFAMSFEQIIGKNTVFRVGGLTERIENDGWDYQVAGTVIMFW